MVPLIFLAAIGVGCSDDSLGSLGGRSSAWIDVPISTSTESVVVTPMLPVRPVDDIVWFNDDLGLPEDASPQAVLGRVIDRAPPGDRYLPASRFEIAVVVPQLKFPALVPVEVDAITSQLVSPRRSGVGPGETAAFGMWDGEPYGSSRTVGQVGVLGVDLLEEGAGPITCADRGPGCQTMVMAGILGVLVSDSSGTTWSWDDGGFRYHLYLRSGSSEVAAAMIGEFYPLGETVSVPSGGQ